MRQIINECIRIMFYYDINKLGGLYKAQPINPKRVKCLKQK